MAQAGLHSSLPEPWRIALDTGGTFTDFVAWTPSAQMLRLKIPSDGSLAVQCVGHKGARIEITTRYGVPIHDGFFTGARVLFAQECLGEIVCHEANSITLSRVPGTTLVPPCALRVEWPTGLALDAPALGVRMLTATPRGLPLPAMELRLSTTRGTNALLERKGAPVGVIVSDGLDGLLAIADQTRDDLFARVPRPRDTLTHLVQSIPERSIAQRSAQLGFSPRMLRATKEQVLSAADALRAQGAHTIVVSLAHALEHDREQVVCAWLRDAGFRAFAASDLARHGRLLTRTQTAVVHASIEPVLRAFVDRAAQGIDQAGVHIFTSAGVLQPAGSFLARDTLLSGPAGGANAMLAVAKRHRLTRAIGFDMGGTSTDVVRIEGDRVARREECRVGGACVAAPSLAIDTVAAGGGSICSVIDGARCVGPQSAGAFPGPAAIDRGGPLTLTDVNLLLGRLPQQVGSIALNAEASARAVDALGPTGAWSSNFDGPLCAFLDIADARMAHAMERLAVRDAHDPATHTLIAFGGAGGQHACAIADRLRISHIIFPKDAGYLCALGVAQASSAQFATVPLLCPLDAAHAARIDNGVARATATAEAALLRGTRVARTCSAERATVFIRLQGQESSLPVMHASVVAMGLEFLRAFKARYGYEAPPRGLEVESVSVRVALDDAWVHEAAHEPTSQSTPSTPTRFVSQGEWRDASRVDRESLRVGDSLDGPMLIVSQGDTVVLDKDWTAIVHESGDLVAHRSVSAVLRQSDATRELFTARLEAIALSMGELLERTALSPNIRDRLDFSCAVLESGGTLVQNAPHLPVHLGALGVCVRAVMESLALREGDVAITNHPAFGGSHLPDLTTIAPVFVDGSRIAFVAVRAHHAELGGTRPGSFPPDAMNLAQEGVVFEPFKAISRGIFDEAAVRKRLTAAPYPSRAPDENLADLSAQFAAIAHGVARIAEIAEEVGQDFFTLEAAIELTSSTERLRRALENADIPSFENPRRVERHLDDGTPIRVAIGKLPDGRLRIDFTGSGGVHRGNFNAPLCVTRAAVLYTLRLFLNKPVPMNEGLMEAIELFVPEGLLNPPFTANPSECPPVVAGNVETSQHVVAAMIEALDLSADSQTTMNNVLFGNAEFSVYETLGGGAGAGPEADGADAVHVHMSNTRLTDIDVLERRASVLIRRHAIRPNSGGAGLHRGGNGFVRSYEFLAPAELSFFGSMRTQAPAGRDGGDHAASGRELHTSQDGVTRELRGGVHALNLTAGDVFTVETPGGGGYGRA